MYDTIEKRTRLSRFGWEKKDCAKGNERKKELWRKSNPRRILASEEEQRIAALNNSES